jgi:hypothetical protein
MGPRQLQSQIHADYTTELASWEAYRTGVTGLYAQAVRKDDYNSHLIREYNRKIHVLNQPTGLFIAPFDAGYSFIGSSITAPVGIENIEGYAFPQQTLSAPSGSSYTWSIDGSTVGTSQTFTPTIYHIGKTVSCLVDGTNYSTTVWHPNGISGLKTFWWAAAPSAVTKSGTANAAVNGDYVGKITDILSGADAIAYGVQSYFKTGLLNTPCIQMLDGSFFDIAEPPENIPLNQNYFNVFIGARATGSASSNQYLFSTSSGSSAEENILSFGPLISGNRNYFITASTATGSNYTYTGSAASTGYVVYNAHAAYKEGFVSLRTNGVETISGSLYGTGISASENNVMYFNRAIMTPSASYSNPCDLTVVALFAADTPISTIDRNRIERFIGLLNDVNIELI